MNAQGVGGVSASDVPQILTEQPGANAPGSIQGQNGSAVTKSTLTALFDPSGNYVGSYGIDPDTGAFAAWDKNGNETNFAAFAALHQLANGATPIANDGRGAVLYNSSGQVIGLDVAGYTVNVANSAQASNNIVDGLTNIIDRSGTSPVGSFGYSETANDLVENGASADNFLQSAGYTAAQISSVEQALKTQHAWDPTNATEVGIRQALTEEELSGLTSDQGTVSVGVYDANGNYVGSYGACDGGWQQFTPTAAYDSTNVLGADGISSSAQGQAVQLLTTSVPYATADYTNLRQINVALSAYLLTRNAAEPLSNIVDVIDGGSFTGVVGIDKATGKFAFEAVSSNQITDLDATLLQEGYTQAAISAGEAADTSLSNLTASNLQAVQPIGPAVENAARWAEDFSGLPTSFIQSLTPAQIQNLTPAQIAGLSPQQIAVLSPTQIASFKSQAISIFCTYQWNAFSPSQLSAISTAQLAGTKSVILTAQALNNLSSAQLQSIPNLEIADIQNVTVAKLQALSLAQFSELLPSDVYNLTQAQLASLTAPETVALGTSVFGFNPQQVPLFSNTVLQALTRSEVGELRAATVGALSIAQLSRFTTTQTGGLSSNAGGLTTLQIAALSTAQFLSLSPTALGAIASFASRTPAEIAALSGSQIAGINLSGLTNPQLAILNPTQMSCLTSGQLNSLSTAQLQIFSAAQIGGLTAPQISGLATWKLSALTPQQWLAISAQGLSGFSSPQLGMFIQYLSPQQISELTLPQVSTLSGDQFDVMSTLAKQSFTSTQLEAMSPSQFNADSSSLLCSLTVAQVNSLTIPQFQGIQPDLGPAQIQGLDAAHLAALTPSQIGEFSNWQLGQFTRQQIQLFSAAQIGGLSTSQFSYLFPGPQITVLSAAQLQGLTTTQIQGLASDQVNALTATQLSGLTPAQFASFGAKQIHGLSTSQVRQLTTTQLSGFGTTQIQALEQDQISAFSSTQFASFTDAQLGAVTGWQGLGVSAADVNALSSDQNSALVAGLENSVASAGAGAPAPVSPPSVFPGGVAVPVSSLPTQATSSVNNTMIYGGGTNQGAAPSASEALLSNGNIEFNYQDGRGNEYNTTYTSDGKFVSQDEVFGNGAWGQVVSGQNGASLEFSQGTDGTQSTEVIQSTGANTGTIVDVSTKGNTTSYSSYNVTQTTDPATGAESASVSPATSYTLTAESGTFNLGEAGEIFHAGLEAGDSGLSASIEMLAPLLGLGAVAGDPAVFAGSALAGEVAGFVTGGEATLTVNTPYSTSTWKLGNYGANGTITYTDSNGNVVATSTVTDSVLSGSDQITKWKDGTVIEDVQGLDGQDILTEKNPDGSMSESYDGVGSYMVLGPGGVPLADPREVISPDYYMPVYYFDLNGNPTDADGNWIPPDGATPTDGLSNSMWDVLNKMGLGVGNIGTVTMTASNGEKVQIANAKPTGDYMTLDGVTYSDDAGYYLNMVNTTWWGVSDAINEPYPQDPYPNNVTLPAFWLLSQNQG